MVRGEGEKGRGYSGLQVTGMIERFFLDLKFSIPGCFWVAILGKCILGFFRYSIQYEG